MIKKIIRDIGHYLKLTIFKIQWRKKNKHNYTEATNIFPTEKVIIGNFTYGPLNIKTYRNKTEKLKIGNFCSIAENVVFILGGNHNYHKISTYPFKNKISNNTEFESETKGEIILEDDVWIGYGSTILSGVHIGKGAIIAANSTVTKDIPPYAIYAGNKIIKYRFSQEIIKKINKLDLEKLNKENIIENIDYLYTDINENNIDEILKKLSK